MSDLADKAPIVDPTRVDNPVINTGDVPVADPSALIATAEADLSGSNTSEAPSVPPVARPVGEAAARGAHIDVPPAVAEERKGKKGLRATIAGIGLFAAITAGSLLTIGRTSGESTQTSPYAGAPTGQPVENPHVDPTGVQIEGERNTPEVDPTTGNVQPAMIIDGEGIQQITLAGGDSFELPQLRINPSENPNEFMSSMLAGLAARLTSGRIDFLEFSGPQVARIDRDLEKTQAVVKKYLSGPYGQAAFFDGTDPDKKAVFEQGSDSKGKYITFTGGDLFINIASPNSPTWQKGPEVHNAYSLTLFRVEKLTVWYTEQDDPATKAVSLTDLDLQFDN